MEKKEEEELLENEFFRFAIAGLRSWFADSSYKIEIEWKLCKGIECDGKACDGVKRRDCSMEVAT